MAQLIRTVRHALKSLLLHKLRSGLTMLGIVFGVFSVIAMLAIGEGASAQAQKQVLELGATNIIVRSVKPPEDVSSSGSTSPCAMTSSICQRVTPHCSARVSAWFVSTNRPARCSSRSV